MKKILRAIPLLLLYSAIIYFSIKRPSGVMPSVPYMDKVGHFLAYFALGFTICISLSSKVLRSIFIILSLTLGIILEFVQNTLPYRDMSLADGVFNVLGLALGVLFSLLFITQIKKILKIN